MTAMKLAGEATVTFGKEHLMDGQRATQIILDFEFVPGAFGPKVRDTIDLVNQIMAILAGEMSREEINDTIRINLSGNLPDVAASIGVALPEGAEDIDLKVFRFGKDRPDMNPLEEQYATVFGFGATASYIALRLN